MKKALLLSVVASSMIMAGGDIAPVEPVVETPAPAASGWEFSGTGVVYYQTNDLLEGTVAHLGGATGGDLFDQDTSAADAGIQLRAMNSDVVAGIGAGVEVIDKSFQKHFLHLHSLKTGTCSKTHSMQYW
ncbi:MAG: hypothetical protein IE918_03980 [Campylobacterales bacterium]|nr:hypothetical protein [Campylobacterales bacterium]